jgi:YVTN family beta-propeller protein
MADALVRGRAPPRSVPRAPHPLALCIAALLLPLAAAAAGSSCAQPPALPGRGCAIAPGDRVYTGDQSSNTLTVLSPFAGEVLGTLALGAARLGETLNPQYTRAVNAHGLGASRDGALLASTSVTSNTLTVLRTADLTILSTTSVGRNAHEAAFAADNRTVWVAARGTDAIDVVDGVAGGVLAHVASPGGPSKVLFSPDGATAYANHIHAATLSVIDVAARAVTHTIGGLADDFSSDMMLTPDGAHAWVAHKMTGRVSVVDLAARRVAAVVDTGPETNHPNFAYVNGSLLAFVTVGALNATRVYRLPAGGAAPAWVADVASSGVQPHGLWPSGDGTRMYVVNEHSDTVDEIDTAALRVTRTWRVGQEGQALLYVSDAVPAGAAGAEQQRLGAQGLPAAPTENRLLRVRVAGGARPDGEALLTVRPLPGLDEIQLVGRRMQLNASYLLSARSALCGARVPIVSFRASEPARGDVMGCATAPQVLAFCRFRGVYDLDSARVDESEE